jgi:hypothetical protein
MLVIEFWALAARDPELRRQFAERHDALKSATARVINETLTRTGRRLSLDTERVAVAAAALANGLTLERLAHPEEIGVELLATIAKVIMNGLTVDPGLESSR